MKITDLVLFILVSGIGFIFPWWSLFILCFAWGYFNLSEVRNIFIAVLISHSILILFEGMDLIQVLKLSQIKYLLVPVAGLIFAAVSAVLAKTGRELNHCAGR